MDWINTILVSLSMSVDAMTVGATDGIVEANMKKRKALIIAATFGVFQFVMPVIGYFIGYGFKDYLSKYIPWIAFSLLVLLGIKSIIDWVKELKESKENASEIKESKIIKPFDIFAQGIATSIDALCIGFVYLASPINEALLVFAIIGISTFVLSFTTTLLGKLIGDKLQKYATLIAGLVFIGIGIKILLEGIL